MLILFKKCIGVKPEATKFLQLMANHFLPVGATAVLVAATRAVAVVVAAAACAGADIVAGGNLRGALAVQGHPLEPDSTHTPHWEQPCQRTVPAGPGGGIVLVFGGSLGLGQGCWWGVELVASFATLLHHHHH